MTSTLHVLCYHDLRYDDDVVTVMADMPAVSRFYPEKLREFGGEPDEVSLNASAERIAELLEGPIYAIASTVTRNELRWISTWLPETCDIAVSFSDNLSADVETVKTITASCVDRFDEQFMLELNARWAASHRSAR